MVEWKDRDQGDNRSKDELYCPPVRLTKKTTIIFVLSKISRSMNTALFRRSDGVYVPSRWVHEAWVYVGACADLGCEGPVRDMDVSSLLSARVEATCPIWKCAICKCMIRKR